MKLIRLLHASYDSNPEKLASFDARVGDVEIHSSRINGSDKAILLIGKTDFSPFHLSGGVADITSYLRPIEMSLEIAIDALSVSLGTARKISSPHPCAALIPDSTEDRHALKEFKSWRRVKRPTVFPFADLRMNLLEQMHLVQDRIDGLPLVAAINCHGNGIGKLHDLIRLFERAFALADRKLINPLYAFLSTGIGDYAHKEIHHWISELRHPATHADKRESYLLDRDVISYLPRIHQAAIDVFMNKKTWRDNTSDRLARWHPNPYLTTVDSIINFKQGRDVTIDMQLLDPFGSYPANLEAVLTSPPEEWVLPSEPNQSSGPSVVVHA